MTQNPDLTKQYAETRQAACKKIAYELSPSDVPVSGREVIDLLYEAAFAGYVAGQEEMLFEYINKQSSPPDGDARLSVPADGSAQAAGPPPTAPPAGPLYKHGRKIR